MLRDVRQQAIISWSSVDQDLDDIWHNELSIANDSYVFRVIFIKHAVSGSNPELGLVVI